MLFAGCEENASMGALQCPMPKPVALLRPVSVSLRWEGSYIHSFRYNCLSWFAVRFCPLVWDEECSFGNAFSLLLDSILFMLVFRLKDIMSAATVSTVCCCYRQLISAIDRHKPCMEHPIKFLSRRRPNCLKFKLSPGELLNSIAWREAIHFTNFLLGYYRNLFGGISRQRAEIFSLKAKDLPKYQILFWFTNFWNF